MQWTSIADIYHNVQKALLHSLYLGAEVSLLSVIFRGGSKCSLSLLLLLRIVCSLLLIPDTIGRSCTDTDTDTDTGSDVPIACGKRMLAMLHMPYVRFKT